MTSRRSRPRRSSGSRATPGARGALALFAVVAVLGPGARPRAARADEPASLVERHDGVEIDWTAGTVTATGGAAADLHMPGADVARAGAVRRAEADARHRLGRALAALPAGGGRKLDDASVTRALGRARVTGTDYQSNGGAFVRLTARFVDWLDGAPGGGAPVVVLAVPAMHLAAAPTAKLEGETADVSLGAAVYHAGAAPAEVAVVHAKVDHAGRLVFATGRDAKLGEKLARGTVVIYVGKVLK